jgi:hypothetical protein
LELSKAQKSVSNLTE